VSAPHDVAFLGATRLAVAIRDRRLSPVEATRAYLHRIAALDGALRAYITVRADAALAEARAAEETLMHGGALPPLLGVPLAVKDQFDARGMATTAGSRLTGSALAASDATVVARLRAAGAVLLGKLNLSEFAMGGTVDFPFGQPRNPWNPAHHPGESSGGSGVATAAGLCAASLGEDTGGSVRSPASYCGVVGLRPTWGRISRHGSFPLCWSMDAPGPLGRTVADVALLLGAIAGHDPHDPTTSRRAVPDYAAALGGDLHGVRIGVVRELTQSADTDGEVGAAVTAAAATLEGLGAVVGEVSLPLIGLSGAVFMALADADGAGVHAAWLRTRSAEYDRATRRRLITASVIPAALNQQAQRARVLIRNQILDALSRVDVLLSPTSPTPAPLIASTATPIASKRDATHRLFTRRSYTTPAALAGTPALSVPCGFSRAGLPIGLQLTARPFDEATVLRVGHAYEHATPWHDRLPPLRPD
jgi:aspartyl-tRNA(Asn)/glutamyl-tRNA(Gln) amidotransferase subunit A